MWDHLKHEDDALRRDESLVVCSTVGQSSVSLDDTCFKIINSYNTKCIVGISTLLPT